MNKFIKRPRKKPEWSEEDIEEYFAIETDRNKWILIQPNQSKNALPLDISSKPIKKINLKEIITDENEKIINEKIMKFIDFIEPIEYLLNKKDFFYSTDLVIEFIKNQLSKLEEK